MIIYTRLLLWSDGMAVHPRLILIRPSRRGDAVLLAHEQMHCEQMRRVGVLRFWWRYLAVPAFRQAAEAEAYRVSYSHAPERAAKFATALSTRYCLRLSFDDAMALIVPR